jgi:hypothetical protein
MVLVVVEFGMKKQTSKRKSDVKFIKENGDTMSEADDSPKKKSPRASTKTKKDTSDEEEEDYEVEKIIDMRKVGRNKEFLIKWKGWEREEDQTWETEQNLGNSKVLLKEFLAEKARETSSEKAAPRSRKARKSSSSTPEPRISDEPEVVSIEDSDTESGMISQPMLWSAVVAQPKSRLLRGTVRGHLSSESASPGAPTWSSATGWT